MARSLGPLLAEAAVAVLRASDGARLIEDGRKALQQLDHWAGVLQTGDRAGVSEAAPKVTMREEDGPVVAYPLAGNPSEAKDREHASLEDASAAQWLLLIADLGSDAKHAVKTGKLDLAVDQVIAAAAVLARWHAFLVLFGPAARPNVNLPRWR